MPTRHLPAALHRAQPWKNGLGVSYTIADFPEGAGFDSVQWQVGHTAITADCPFSDLPGMDRQFMVLEGAGVELTCTDATGKASVRRIEPLQPPFAFQGDWRTTCRLLDGPVKVFNVMTRRGKFSAVVSLEPSAIENADDKLIAVALPGLDAWIVEGERPPAVRGLLVRIRRQ